MSLWGSARQLVPKPPPDPQRHFKFQPKGYSLRKLQTLSAKQDQDKKLLSIPSLLGFLKSIFHNFTQFPHVRDLISKNLRNLLQTPPEEPRWARGVRLPRLALDLKSIISLPQNETRFRRSPSTKELCTDTNELLHLSRSIWVKAGHDAPVAHFLRLLALVFQPRLGPKRNRCNMRKLAMLNIPMRNLQRSSVSCVFQKAKKHLFDGLQKSGKLTISSTIFSFLHMSSIPNLFVITIDHDLHHFATLAPSAVEGAASKVLLFQ